MAKLVDTIEITDMHRPCWYVGEEQKEKAIFHRWIVESRAVEDPARTGHTAGVISTAFALIEMGNGRIWKVYPENVQFADHGDFMEFTWGDEND